MELCNWGKENCMDRKQYDALNMIRLFASVFVVFIHCPFDEKWGGILFQ
jgi:hypothetical protein